MNLFGNEESSSGRLGKTVLIALICIPLWITVVRYSAWKMAAFLFFWILCPGIFVDKYILQQEQEDFLMSVFSGFFMGMALVSIEWFVLYVIGFRQLIIFINPGFTMVSFVLYFLKRKGRTLSAERQRRSINTPFLIMLLTAVYLCAFSLNFRMPRAIDIGSVDCTWQIGNINQLASDFPFRDIRVVGVKARYHFFSTMFLAIAKYIFGGEGWVYFAQYQIWFLPFIITISLWQLYGKVVSNKYFVAVMSIATMTGFSLNSSYGMWNYHIFSNVNSAGLGISCLILLFLKLKKGESLFSEKRKLEKVHFLWGAQQILFLFLLTGIKGPLALLYVLSVCTWAVIQRVKGKMRGAGFFAFAVVNVLVFSVMYRVLFVAGTQGYFSDCGADSVLRSVLDGREIANLYERSGFDGILGRAVFLLPSLLATFTVLLPFGLLAVFDLIRFLFGRQDVRGDLVFSYIFAGGGLCAYYMFHTPDNVQVYFLFAAMPFIGYLCFDRAFALIKAAAWRKVFCIVILAFSIFTVNSNMIRSVTEFPNRFACYLKGVYPEAKSQRALRFEAYDFLRNYTDKNAMVATNEQGAGTFHEISAFGERSCYLEGYEYSVENFGFDQAEERLREMERLFDIDWNEVDRYNFCELFGISYLVCFKDVADQPLKLSGPFRNVFDNDAVVIYEVKRQS